MHHKPSQINYKKRALLLAAVLTLTGLISLLWILFHSTHVAKVLQNPENALVADIYQNGALIKSIPLTTVAESYSFTVNGAGGAFNEIEVRPGSIGIVSANCPDKLCVHQGFIESSLIPITCLPNHLVVQIRMEEKVEGIKPTPDVVAY